MHFSISRRLCLSVKYVKYYGAKTTRLVFERKKQGAAVFYPT